MSTTNRNIALAASSVLQGIFNASPPIYIPWGKVEDYTAGNYESISTIDIQNEDIISGLGTPVLGSFTFLGGKYDSYDNSGNIIDLELDDFVMPYATIVDFNRNMNITKTKVLGNAGSVKEIYGLDDWIISIRGFCADDQSRISYKTAKEQIEALVQWRNVTDTINVSGELFNDKEIYGLCIEDLQIRAIQGKYNVIAFDIKAISDNVIELAI